MPVNHSTLAGPRHAAAPSPDRRRRRRLRVTALAVAAAASLGALTAPSSAPAEAAATKTYVGAAGQVDTLVNKSRAPMALHSYSSFGRRVPANADMISVRSSASWAQVAAAKPGSSIYNQIAAFAKGVKALNRSVMVAYHHEPEASGSRRYGNAEQFKAAYRKVVSIFNAQGATNVEWTLQTTAYAYRVKPSDRRSVAKWYPGDAYVDNVGGDGYSWNGCEGHGGSASVASIAGPIVKFAKAHGKKASLPEFGAAPGAQRAKWLRDLHTYLKANRTMTAAFYFHNGPLDRNDSCTWLLKSAAEFDAYGDIARDTANFKS
jgi:beta-mannanase